MGLLFLTFSLVRHQGRKHRDIHCFLPIKYHLNYSMIDAKNILEEGVTELTYSC